MHSYSRVGLFGSNYSLMIYLLYSSKEEINETFFVFTQGIPNQVRNYFKSQCLDLTNLPKNKILKELIEIFIHFTKYIRWPFMLKAEYWGMPIVGIELLGKKSINQIEEGGEHLGLSANNPRKLKWLRRLLHGWWFENYTLDNPKIKTLVLTRPLKYKTNPNCKQVVIDLNKLWEEHDDNRKILLESHGITNVHLKDLSKCKYLLLTQTFAEDKTLPLEREIELYRQLVNGIDYKELLIKPHPRAYVERISYFPGASIFDVKCPMQLLALCGFRPKVIFTINSTSVFSLPYKDVEIKFLGTECDERLIKRFGIMKSNFTNN